nr:MAG TPA: hypothetical protein [Caudoviricetes sp.]
MVSLLIGSANRAIAANVSEVIPYRTRTPTSTNFRLATGRPLGTMIPGLSTRNPTRGP